MKVLNLFYLSVLCLPIFSSAQDSIDPLTLQGTWGTIDLGSPATWREVEIEPWNEGLKVHFYGSRGSYMYFQEKVNPVYTCTQVKKTLMSNSFPPEYIGSSITVVSKYHIRFFNKTNETTTDWVKHEGAVIAENGDFSLRGTKLGKTLKTENGSLLTDSSPDFTIYDVNGVARFLADGTNDRIVFLDDEKSTIPNWAGYSVKALGRFFSYDSILTATGYNEAYRTRFIRKHGGFDAANNNTEERDRNAQITLIAKNIQQDGTVIGYMESYVTAPQDLPRYFIRDLQNKLVAIILVEPGNYNLKTMRITDPNNKNIKTFEQSLDAFQHMAGIKWLVDNRFL